MNKHTRLASFLVNFAVSCFGLNLSNAAIFTFSGSGQANASMLLSGTLGSSGFTPFSTSPNSAFMAVSLDDETFTMSYDEIRLSADAGLAISLSADVTTGLGQSSSISSIINFDAVTLRILDSGTVDLTPFTGGDFLYSSGSPFAATGSVNIGYSGTYTITDGSDTRNGTFDIDVPATYELEDGRLQTSDFPDSITIGSSGVSAWRIRGSETVDLFSETYGTTDIVVNTPDVNIQVNNFMTLQAVPEPTTAILATLGGFLLLNRRMRT